jgi:hypothetical protein
MARKWLLRRPLTIEEILSWADAYRETTGRWPTKDTGAILGAKFETWLGVDAALRGGLRTLPGNSSLAQLLAEHRGVRNIHGLPTLSEGAILQWAEAHHQRTGAWPSIASGVIPDTAGETWKALDTALRLGARGLPGGRSLARLLAECRGVRHRRRPPRLTIAQILRWADAHHARTGAWPKAGDGAIADAPGDTWLAVDMALRHGRRGLAGGLTLALLLANERQARNAWSRPSLTAGQVLAWADAVHERTGDWPHAESGAVADAPGETWLAVDHALKRGGRGMPGGSSLADLLAAERGVRNLRNLPPLTRKQILAWADAHRKRTGRWPTVESGSIPDAPGESWITVNEALRKGTRSLRGGSSVARFLSQYRGKRSHIGLPALSQKKILVWADAHFQRTGKWPNTHTGPVVDAPGETWALIDNALNQGHRGLPGGSSLLRLLVRKRGVRDPMNLPALTEEQVLGWARVYFERTGEWPAYYAGAIADAPGETWARVDSALRLGKRTLPGGSSLAKLLVRVRIAAGDG